VHDSLTGRRLETRAAPRGVTFLDLAATGDGRTLFVLMTVRKAGRCGSSIARFSVGAMGNLTGYQRVPGSYVTGTPKENGSLAVSSSGRRLAYSVESCSGDIPNGQRALSVRFITINTLSGERREWTETQYAGDGNISLSASGDWLFFVRSRYEGDPYADLKEVHELRRLSVATAPAGRVVAVSDTIRKVAAGQQIAGVVASPDGRHAVIVETTVGQSTSDEVVSSPAPFGVVELLEISADDGRVLRSIRRAGTGVLEREILKGDAFGRFVITNSGLFDLTDDQIGIRLPAGVKDCYDLEW